ncbi:hypothetical protein IFT84_01375 [Rhizobium sp. CFBP 8762]|uniref:hypothetical protein n=1 Tax=Rhizobium sp. CFBP 8762 TaxID=2775279 RepID=UPI00178615E5|nr:hypothetical protein [Rhizobium sp. CFBP 8762]MBD8553167.1 hypothetical protein [Rhizobium sp. CFBP 8762]
MASPLIIAVLATHMAGFAAPGGDVSYQLARAANDCSQAAAEVVDKTGGDLLSAQPTGDGACIVTVLVKGNGGRPKKVTMKVEQ